MNLWTGFSLLGFCAAAYYAFDNWRDRVNGADWVERRYITARLIVSVGIAAAEGAMASVGVMVIVLDPTRLIGQVTTWALVTTSGVLAAVVLLLTYNKRRTRKEMSEREETE